MNAAQRSVALDHATLPTLVVGGLIGATVLSVLAVGACVLSVVAWACSRPS